MTNRSKTPVLASTARFAKLNADKEIPMTRRSARRGLGAGGSGARRSSATLPPRRPVCGAGDRPRRPVRPRSRAGEGLCSTDGVATTGRSLVRSWRDRSHWAGPPGRHDAQGVARFGSGKSTARLRACKCPQVLTPRIDERSVAAWTQGLECRSHRGPHTEAGAPDSSAGPGEAPAATPVDAPATAHRSARVGTRRSSPWNEHVAMLACPALRQPTRSFLRAVSGRRSPTNR